MIGSLLQLVDRQLTLQQLISRHGFLQHRRFLRYEFPLSQIRNARMNYDVVNLLRR